MLVKLATRGWFHALVEKLQLGKPPFGFLTLGVETAPVRRDGFLSSSQAHHLVEGQRQEATGLSYRSKLMADLA